MRPHCSDQERAEIIRRKEIQRRVLVEIRAREMWQQLGRPRGRDEEIWIAAEMDVA